jgi:hypothetical protein
MEKLIGQDAKLIEKFLDGMYGGKVTGRDGGKGKFMTPEEGVDLGVMREGAVGRNPFFEEEVSDAFLSLSSPFPGDLYLD